MTKELLDAMMKDEISDAEKVHQLKHELAEHYQNKKFEKARSMGEIVKISLTEMIRKNMQHFKRKI